VPQGRGIFPALSVYDNIRMGIAAHEEDEEDAVRRILQDFPRLERLLERDGSALSGGEQQLLAIARCLISEPELVLLDEPSEGIQPSIVDEIIELLRNHNRQRGITIILVEQNLEFITELSGRILMLQKGQIAGEVSNVSAADPALIREFVGFGADRSAAPASRPRAVEAPPAPDRPVSRTATPPKNTGTRASAPATREGLYSSRTS
jgi:amidase